MLDRVVNLISRWIHRDDFVLVPGQFETFLDGVSQLPEAGPRRS